MLHHVVCVAVKVAFYDKFHKELLPGGVLKEFLGGDVPLGPWNP